MIVQSEVSAVITIAIALGLTAILMFVAGLLAGRSITRLAKCDGCGNQPNIDGHHPECPIKLKYAPKVTNDRPLR